MDSEKMLAWLLHGVEAIAADSPLSDDVFVRLSGLVDRERVRRQPTKMLPTPPRTACALLGDPTGEMRLCETCTGKVELKVMVCSVHGACTIGRKVDGLECCASCNSHQEREHVALGKL